MGRPPLGTQAVSLQRWKKRDMMPLTRVNGDPGTSFVSLLCPGYRVCSPMILPMYSCGHMPGGHRRCPVVGLRHAAKDKGSQADSMRAVLLGDGGRLCCLKMVLGRAGSPQSRCHQLLCHFCSSPPGSSATARPTT